MGNRRIYRFIAVLMALQLLFTTSVVAVDVHYCQGRAKSISLYGTAPSCHQMSRKSGCRHHTASCHRTRAGSDEDNCCHNEKHLIKKADADHGTVAQPTLPAFEFHLISAVATVFLKSLRVAGATRVVYALYSRPPTPVRDIFALYQSFLF